jgi:hypothetical protein
VSREGEIDAVVTELERLLGQLRSGVDGLQAILTSPTAPEVPGDQPAPA